MARYSADGKVLLNKQTPNIDNLEDFKKKAAEDAKKQQEEYAQQMGQSLKSTAEQLAELEKRFADLSERQRQVVELAVQGLSNKEIGLQLSISPRTVEHYRESAMERMQATRFAELIQMVVRLKAQKARS